MGSLKGAPPLPAPESESVQRASSMPCSAVCSVLCAGLLRAERRRRVQRPGAAPMRKDTYREVR